MKEFAGLASDSREVKPGYLVCGAARNAAPNGAQFISDAVKRGAIAVLGRPEAAATREGAGRALHRRRKSARAVWRAWRRRSSARSRRRSPPSPARTARRPSPFSCARSGRALGKRAASMGTIGVVTPTGEIALAHTTPDPIEIAPPARAIEAGRHRSSGAGSVQPRPRSISPRRRRISRRPPSPTSRAIIWIITPTFEPISRPSCGCSAKSCADGGVAVINADARHAEDFVRAPRGARLERAHGRRNGETLKLARARAAWRRPDAERRYEGARYQGRAAARRRVSGLERAGRGGAGHRPGRCGRDGVRGARAI